MGGLNIIIEPTMAFGNGEHPTTQICLTEIERLASEGVRGSLLDIGTGSGILSIAAAKLGFREITALDIDPVAVESARRNVSRNCVDSVTVLYEPPESLKRTFTVIVANLTAETIKTIIDDILKCMGNDSICILSGILRKQAGEIRGLLRSKGITKTRVLKRMGWCGIVFVSD